MIDTIEKKSTYFDSQNAIITLSADFFNATITSDGKFDNFLKYINHIKSTCNTFFPECVFKSDSLGNQSIFDLTNCGPFMTEYAWRIISGQSLSSIPDPFYLRVEQQGVLRKPEPKSILVNSPLPLSNEKIESDKKPESNKKLNTFSFTDIQHSSNKILNTNQILFADKTPKQNMDKDENKQTHKNQKKT